MPQLKKILVPIDFSELSHRALAYACDLARDNSAALTLLHIYQLPQNLFPDGYLAFTASATEELLRYLERGLSDTQKDIGQRIRGPVSTKLVQGVPHVEIVREAEEGGFDLVVMGSHGRTGLRHALLGSVAERVVRRAPCPVLVVRTREKAGEKKP
jgi:nucleotide-binding universal stress UspA family protein